MATINSASNGNWGLTSSWSGGVVPTTGDTVNIAHVITYNINNDTNTITTININAGGELKWVGLSGTLTLRFTNMVINGGKLTLRDGTFLRCLGSIQVNNTNGSQIDALGTDPNSVVYLQSDSLVGSTEIAIDDTFGLMPGDYVSVYDENNLAWNNQTNECFILSDGNGSTYNVRRFVGTKITVKYDTILNDNAIYLGYNESINQVEQAASDFNSDYISFWTGESCTTSYHGPNNMPAWVTSQGSYTNNTGTWSDGTLTAQTLNLTTGAGYDMYKNYLNIVSGVTYSVSMWVKLGTATNLCVCVSNGSSWIGGQVFTSADGLNTSTWTQITYTFVGVASNQINLYLGDNLQTSPVNLSSTQTAGTVFIKGVKVSSASTSETAIRLRSTTTGTFYMRVSLSTINMTAGMLARVRFKAKSDTLTTIPSVLYFDSLQNIKNPPLTTTYNDYEFIGIVTGSIFYISIPNSAIGNLVDITNVDIRELKDDYVGSIIPGMKFVSSDGSMTSYEVESVDIYNKIVYTTQPISNIFLSGSILYESGVEKNLLTGYTVYALHYSIFYAARGLNYIDVSNSNSWNPGDVISLGGNTYAKREDKIISSIPPTYGINGSTRIYFTTNLLYDHFVGGLATKVNRDCVFHGNTTDTIANTCGYIYVLDGNTTRRFYFKNFEMRYYGNNGSTLYAGLTNRNYITQYTFNVTGVTVTPSVGATYTIGGNGYSTITNTVVSTNISGGSGTILVTANSAWPPLSSGTMTKTGGTGDATISFSSWIGVSDKFINISGRHAAKTSNNGMICSYSYYYNCFINNVVYDTQWGIGVYSSGAYNYFSGNTAIGVGSVGITCYNNGYSNPWEYNIAEACNSYGFYLLYGSIGPNNLFSFNNLPTSRLKYFRSNFNVTSLYLSAPSHGISIDKISIRNMQSRIFYNDFAFGASSAYFNNCYIEEGFLYGGANENPSYIYSDSSIPLGVSLLNNYNMNLYKKSIRYTYGYCENDYAIRTSNKYSWKFYPKQNSSIYFIGFFALVQANKGTIVKVGGFARKLLTGDTTKCEILDFKGNTLSYSVLSSTSTWEWITTSYTASTDQNLIVRIGGYGSTSSFWIDTPMLYNDNNITISGAFDNFWVKADPSIQARRGVRLTNKVRIK